MRRYNSEPQVRWSLLPLYRIWISGLIMFVVLCSSCQIDAPVNKTTSQPVPTPVSVTPTVLTPHVLTIGNYKGYFPQSYVDKKSGETVGFDIDVITMVARYLNLRPKIVSGAFTDLIPDLQDRHFDVVISAFPITPDLQKEVDFVPYFKGGETLLVPNGNRYKIAALTDLCGRRVAVRSGTFEQGELEQVGVNCMAQQKPGITLVIEQTDQSVITLLARGKVDASYQDAPVADYFMHMSPGSFVRVGKILGRNVQGIAVRKGEEALLRAIEHAFKRMRADGTYRQLINKWGLVTGDITRSAPNGQSNNR